MTIKSNEANVILSPIPSVDIDETGDTPHRPLAPLASSETFSDGVGLNHDEQDNKNNNQQTDRKIPKTEFDSLEVLFDFPSSGISSDAQLDIEQTSESTNHIRFSDANRTITSDKVLDLFKYLSIFIFMDLFLGRTKDFTN